MADQYGIGDLYLPLLTLEGTDVGAKDIVELPLLECEGSGPSGEAATFGGNLPSLVLSSTTRYGMAGVGSFELSIPTLAASGAPGQFGTADIDFPSLAMDGGDAEAGSFDVDLPAISLAATGITGQAGQLSSSFPNFALAATGVREGDNYADLTFPALVVASSGLQQGLGQGACQISLLTLQAQGLAGEAGIADLTFPVFTITSTGGGSYAGTASIILPAFILEATLETDLASSLTAGIVDISVYTMNLSNFAVSTFTNYPFNSYCLFNGSYLGARADGIYLLSGDQDAAANIEAEMLKEAIGQEVSNKKGIPVIYVNLETDGQYDLTIKSEDQSVAYPGIPYHEDLRLQKIKVGRGLKGRYFGIGLKNRDGGAMRINSIEIPVEISATRKGR